MGPLDVLVHMRQYNGDPPALRAALALSRRIDVHLHGLYVAPIPPAAFTSPETVAVLVHESDRHFREARVADDWWREKMKAGGARGDWLVAQSDTLDAIAYAARWNDLIVIERPQNQPDAPLGWGLVSRSAFAAGTPLLVIPDSADVGELGHRVVVLWNGSREAIRAVHGALPLLQRADSVVVIDGEHRGANGGLLHLPAFDLRRHLQIHAIAAEFQPFTAPDDRGAGLLAAARALDADLIVMGAWGHSRIAELIVGGVTRHLFQNADRALFVAH
ncbi:MAG: universal stress protein [Rhodanobacteraceae bacterium]|nr:universal stress protein [Rhodanobacteraceae bacterium]